MISRKKVLGDYSMGKTIGQGAFSKVKIGTHIETNEKVAIKVIDKKQMALKAAKAKAAQEEREKRKKVEEERRKIAYIAALQAQGLPIPPELQNFKPTTPSITNNPIFSPPTTLGVKPNTADQQQTGSPQATEGVAVKLSTPSNSGKLDEKSGNIKSIKGSPESNSVAPVYSHSRSSSKVTSNTGNENGIKNVSASNGNETCHEKSTHSTSSGKSKEQESDLKSSSPIVAVAESGASEPEPVAEIQIPVVHPDFAMKKEAGGALPGVPQVDEKDKEPEYIPEFVRQLQTEVQLLMRLDHPNVIKVYQVVDTEDECFVVMEYASGGELIDYIASKGRLTEKEARRIFRQLISALDHCHLANVVHRDLKLENLLLNADKNILISDFGLGRTYRSDMDDYMKTFCGTPNYAAVELISGIPYIGVKSDVWAMGVILYVMMTGRPPFYGENISALYSKIKSIDYKCPDYFSQELKDLLAKILVKDPSQRIDMEGLRNDAWVNFGEEELPPRIPPRSMGHGEAANPSQFIKGITYDQSCTIYTFRHHTLPAKPIIDVQVTQRRRRSKTAIPDANKISEEDEEDEFEEDQLSPLPEPFVAAKNDLIRRMSIGKQDPSSDPSSQTGAAPTAESNTVESRRHVRRYSTGRQIAQPQSPPVQVPETLEPEMNFLHRMSMPSVNLEIPVLDLRKRNAEPSANPHRRVSSAVPKGGQNSWPSSPTSGNGESPADANDIVSDLEPILDSPVEKIQEWHLLHKPPKEIRSVRFGFNSATTSELPPSAIFQDVHRVLILLQARYANQISFTRVEDYYVFNCQLTTPNPDDNVQFEIEVCKVWLMKLHGVKIKRISGNALIFKEIYENVVYDLRI